MATEDSSSNLLRATSPIYDEIDKLAAAMAPIYEREANEQSTIQADVEEVKNRVLQIAQRKPKQVVTQGSQKNWGLFQYSNTTGKLRVTELNIQTDRLNYYDFENMEEDILVHFDNDGEPSMYYVRDPKRMRQEKATRENWSRYETTYDPINRVVREVGKEPRPMTSKDTALLRSKISRLSDLFQGDPSEKYPPEYH